MTLFADNIVYAASTTRPAERDAYFDEADKLVPTSYDRANQIFANNGLNLYIVEWVRSDIVDDKADIVGVTGNLSNPDDASKAEMEARHHPFPSLIGIHWAEWLSYPNTTGVQGWGRAPCGGADCDQVILAGYIHHPETVPGHDLAHELGHYFGLPHVSDTRNLMYDGALDSSGTQLTADQRNLIWQTINTGRTGLTAVTCDGGPSAPPSTPASLPSPNR